MSVRDYSTTPASNTTIASIDIAEGCSPAGINNAIRQQMADVADVVAGNVGLNVLSLTDDANTYAMKFQAPATLTATTTFTLPDGDGTDGQTLLTDGAGNLSWGLGGGGSFLGEAGGGLGDIIRVHEEQIDTDVTVAANTNGLAAGPLIVNATITINGNLTVV